MRKTLLAALAAIALITAGVQTASAEDWMSLAMNEYGWGYAEGRNDPDAKVRAIEECRYETGVQCYAAVSVPKDWYMVGIYCDGEPSVAASQRGWERAEDLAAEKLGYRRGFNEDYCFTEVRY